MSTSTLAIPELILESLPVAFARFGAKVTSGDGFIRDGFLTKPVKIGKASRLPHHEVVTITAARMAGQSDAEIREIVIDLMARCSGSGGAAPLRWLPEWPRWTQPSAAQESKTGTRSMLLTL